MNRISKETNIGFGLLFSISFWAAVDGVLPFLYLLIFPVSYAAMHLIIWLFIWRKKGNK